MTRDAQALQVHPIKALTAVFDRFDVICDHRSH
jgi:hypothetical protein